MAQQLFAISTILILIGLFATIINSHFIIHNHHTNITSNNNYSKHNIVQQGNNGNDSNQSVINGNHLSTVHIDGNNDHDNPGRHNIHGNSHVNNFFNHKIDNDNDKQQQGMESVKRNGGKSGDSKQNMTSKGRKISKRQNNENTDNEQSNAGPKELCYFGENIRAGNAPTEKVLQTCKQFQEKNARKKLFSFACFAFKAEGTNTVEYGCANINQKKAMDSTDDELTPFLPNLCNTTSIICDYKDQLLRGIKGMLCCCQSADCNGKQDMINMFTTTTTTINTTTPAMMTTATDANNSTIYYILGAIGASIALVGAVFGVAVCSYRFCSGKAKWKEENGDKQQKTAVQDAGDKDKKPAEVVVVKNDK